MPPPGPLSISCWAPGDWSESDRRWGRAGRGRAHCSSERPKGESGAALRPQDGGLPACPQTRVSTSGPERLQPGPLCAGCGPRARAWPGRAVAWPLCGQLPGAAAAHRWTRTLCPPGGSVCTCIDPPHAPPGLLLSPVLQMGKLRPGGQQVLSQVRSQGLRSDHLVLKPHVLCSPPAGPGPRCEAWARDPAAGWPGPAATPSPPSRRHGSASPGSMWPGRVRLLVAQKRGAPWRDRREEWAPRSASPSCDVRGQSPGGPFPGGNAHLTTQMSPADEATREVALLHLRLSAECRGTGKPQKVGWSQEVAFLF